MWKNIPTDAKERFPHEGWQRKIIQNHPRSWSTSCQDYGVFTTPTVRWRLEMEAAKQNPAAGQKSWETTNSHYGDAIHQFNKTTYRKHVTSTATVPINTTFNRYQRSRLNPHPGVRLDRILEPKKREGFEGVRAETGCNTANSDRSRKKKLVRNTQLPSMHEKFLRARYITPWNMSYHA